MGCGVCAVNNVKARVRMYQTNAKATLGSKKVSLWFGTCETCGGLTDPCLTMTEAKNRCEFGWYNSINGKPSPLTSVYAVEDEVQ